MSLLNLLVLAAAANPICSIRTQFQSPSANHTLILAVATGEIVSVKGLNTIRFHSELPDTSTTAKGWRFRVIEVAGGDGSIKRGDTFTAIPWEYDPSCRPLLWGKSSWVPEAAEALFQLGVRRPEARGTAVFDVLGWHQAYPYGELLKYARLPAPYQRGDKPTARELYETLTSAPAKASPSP